MRRLLFAVLLGCGAAPSEPSRPMPTTAAASVTSEPPPPPKNEWALVTRTPAVASTETRDAREVALLASCDGEDAALTKVAREIAEDRAQGQAAPDADGVVARLRRAGDPHVRPRLFVATGRAPIDETKLKPAMHGARCGAAFASNARGDEAVVMLRAETLADLLPLPTHARTGEWLTFEAHLRVPARSAKLVVLGPRGLPRNVPTSQDGNVVHARFALDQPGAFTVQLLAELADGPKPLLEARVFADVTPALNEDTRAPGEEPGNDAAALARMIAALRVAEGVSPLVHDDKLDAFARAHAERMRAGHTVAHDLGDGDFKERFEADGTMAARAVGENVAHAATVPLAHRALYASPSHRMNLLRADYTHFGVAVAHADDGSVYACETFLSRAH